jgi:2-oxoglutarate ferredoxin oxidoreductase subunit delta
MAKVRGAVVVENELCKGCNLCVVACPQNVLALHKEVNSKGYHYSYMANPEACTGCTNCAVVCPDSCITVYRVNPAKIA